MNRNQRAKKHPRKNLKKHKKASAKAPFLYHLEELRRRAWWCVVILFIGTIIGYEIRNNILNFLIKPLHNPLFYTSPTGGFEFIFQISLFFGILFALPFIAYNLYRFLEPAMPSHSYRIAIYFFLGSFIAIIFGILFAYFVTLPYALRFFNSFDSNKIKALISTNEYLSFMMRYILGFCIAFQFPIILIAANYIKPFNPAFLMKKQRTAILIIFIVILLITPPDPTTQILAAIPLILLFELSIVVIWYMNRAKKVIYMAKLR